MASIKTLVGDSGISPTWRGGFPSRLIDDVPATVEFNEFGIASATMGFICPFHSSASLVNAVKTHPDFDWLKRRSAVATREEANLGRVIVTFEGIPPEEEAGTEGEVTEGRLFYSLRGALSTEPIETHPRFSQFAGTKGNELNGAKFDTTTGKFLGFNSQTTDAHKKKFGVRSYIAPTVIYEQNWIRSGVSAQAVQISANRLGAIDPPPSSNVLPQVNASRSWILSGCDVFQIGEGVQQNKQWRLSGPAGWDPDWYS